MAGISRQTVYAMEDGGYLPNTAVALRLARVLDVQVEDLFALEEEPGKKAQGELRKAVLLTAWKRQRGLGVRVTRVGEKLVAVPVSSRGPFLPVVNGEIASDGEDVQTGSFVPVKISNDAEVEAAVVIAGCDPALSVLVEIAQQNGLTVLAVLAGSHQALDWLRKGWVHLAGSHLTDKRSGEPSLDALRRLFPKDKSSQAVTFASWRLGLAQRAGSLGVRSVSDAVQAGMTTINRERGAGSRELFDRLLARAGVQTGAVKGYERIAHGHLDAAAEVTRGRADYCVASEAAAAAFGLEFGPLQEQRFDLCTTTENARQRAVEQVLDLLQTKRLRSALAATTGYETRETGKAWQL